MTDQERIAELERLVALLLKERGGEKLVAHRAAKREFTPPVLSNEQIILTSNQAQFISSRTNKLVPRPLTNGKYAITVRALDDVNHQALNNFLSGLERREVAENEWLVSEG
jgi:hypothetical protein